MLPTSQQNGSILSYSKVLFIDTKINTKVDANVSLLTFEGTIKKKYDNHIFRAYTTAYLSSLEGAPVKNKWTSQLDYDYQFGKRYSFNYILGYRKDHFSGSQYQIYTGPSIGIKMIDQGAYTFDLRGNILFDKNKPEEEQSDLYLSSRLGAIYTWRVQDNLKFIQEGSYKVRFNETENYIFYSKSAIESKIAPNLSVGVSYKVDCINSPSTSLLNTNRTFSTLLILKY